MALYRVLLALDCLAAAVLSMVFLFMYLTTPSPFPGVIVWIALLAFAGAAIGSGVYFRQRGEMVPSTLSLALLAVPSVLACVGGVWLFQVVSNIEVL
jgi:hypothetical protein